MDDQTGKKSDQNIHEIKLVLKIYKAFIKKESALMRRGK